MLDRESKEILLGFSAILLFGVKLITCRRKMGCYLSGVGDAPQSLACCDFNHQRALIGASATANLVGDTRRHNVRTENLHPLVLAMRNSALDKLATRKQLGTGPREPFMPLMRGRVVGYDANRMTFRFAMLNQGETVECEISSAALDVFAREGSLRYGDREPIFETYRDTIERVASDMFDKQIPLQGRIIRIFAKHVVRPRLDNLS